MVSVPRGETAPEPVVEGRTHVRTKYKDRSFCRLVDDHAGDSSRTFRGHACRAVTIFPNGSPAGKLARIMINPGVGTLAECRETIKDMSELTAADDGMIFMCIPADLNDGSMIDRGLPLQQYQAN